MTVTSGHFDPNLLKALNEMNLEDYSIPKYDMKIGMLVFVKTKNNWGDWSTNTIPSHWYVPIQVNPQPLTPYIQPNTNTPYPYYPNVGGGGTYTPHTIPWNNPTGPSITPATPYGPYDTSGGEYYWNPNTGPNYTLCSNEINVEKDERFASSLSAKASEIKDLLSSYQTNFGSNKLGMSMMTSRKSRKSAEHLVRKQRQVRPKNQNYNSIGSGIGSINIGVSSSPTIIGGTTNITCGTSTVTISADFAVHGYKTIKDYFQKNTTKIDQKESWSDEELKNLSKSGFALFSGKPFNGIIVDKFVPKMRSEKGEEIGETDLDMPVLYKVLFGEKNVLWVTEDDLLPMKPKECARRAL